MDLTPFFDPRTVAPMVVATVSLLLGTTSAGAQPGSSGVLDTCHGLKQQMVVTRQMPYVLAKVGNASGYFLLDHGSNVSSIDPAGFLGGNVPKPTPGTNNRFDAFDFYGGWGSVTLAVQDHSNLQGLSIRQAGIIGTDFLALNAFTVDYRGGAVFRSDSVSFCSDNVLRAEGFTPVSTLGYFPTDTSRINPIFPRIPTVPVRIGPVPAIAQLDPGYDDTIHRHSVNINRALFLGLAAAGVRLDRIPGPVQTLTTCAGVNETVTSYRLLDGHRFEIIGMDGRVAVAAGDAVIHVKDTPLAAKRCGGIGTWSIPGAQVAASFFVEAGRMVFDPYSQRVWFGR